ncbi:hypothetical protein J0A68_19250 [Algoriphagus sp. H41]|uniref:DUF5675 domain-containing protein n=1 Tax=Algoriphagus oliviformis TaxID=2811231 RepID=A0ABS3CA98_9BACT|nr:hypothetical protein [Algoriphagus oliviformis]MBN7813100.1 hypothetical protein [Algoriphagus oliviformis]
MRLLLMRRYTPRVTLGRLFLGNRQVSFIREAPKACCNPGLHCLEEGVYELEPVHTEEEGWRIRVGDRGWIRSKAPNQAPGSGELCPVSAYRADGTPLFTQLAFLKLMDELEPVWEKGEVVELQIVARTLPYSQPTCRIAACS